MLRLLAGCFLVAVLAAACGGGGDSSDDSGATTAAATGAAAETTTAAVEATTAEEEITTIRVSVAEFGSQRFPLDIIESQGLDEKYGFKLERVPFTGPPANYLQLTGDESDLAPATWLEVQQNLARGLEVVGIGPLFRFVNPLVVAADSDIQEIPDLKGKRIGVYFLGGTDVQAVRAAIQKEYGFDLFEEATVTQADAPLLSKQLERGDLDAIFTFSNLATVLVADNEGRVLFTASDLLVDALDLSDDDPFGIYVTSPDVINNFPERITKYLAAYREAVDILLTDDSVWPDLAANLDITDEAGIVALRDTERQIFSTTWDEAVVERMQTIFDVLLDVGGTEITGVEKFDPSVFRTDFWAESQ